MLLLDKYKALGWSHRGETTLPCVIVPSDLDNADMGMSVPTDDCESMKSATTIIIYGVTYDIYIR